VPIEEEEFRDVAGIIAMRNGDKIFFGKHEGKRPETGEDSVVSRV
jgi:hypothetical protein